MAGYIVFDIEVTNPEDYQEYAKRVPSIIAQYGGKYLARGGAVEPLEGDWQPSRFVILEFESVEQAKRFFNSPEYELIKTIRTKNSKSRGIIVHGL